MRTRTRIHSLTRARTHTHTHTRERERESGMPAYLYTPTHQETNTQERAMVPNSSQLTYSVQNTTKWRLRMVNSERISKKMTRPSTQTHDRAFKARGMVKERKRAPDLLLKLCVHRYVCGVFVPVCMCVRHTAASIKRTEKVKTLRMTSFMPDITVMVDWA